MLLFYGVGDAFRRMPAGIVDGKENASGVSAGGEKTKRPGQKSAFCQGRIKAFIRGATLIHSPAAVPLQGTIIPPATDVCLPRCRILCAVCRTFDCTLRGPFDGLFPACIAAPQALWEGIAAVISASTVYTGGIARFFRFVNAGETIFPGKESARRDSLRGFPA